MHEKTQSKPRKYKKETKKKQKKKPIHRLITKRKRAYERRERITSRESPSPRPIKKSPTLPFFYFLFYFPKASISQNLIYTTPFKKFSTPSQPFASTYFFFFRLLNLCFFRHSNFPVHTFYFFLPFFSFLKPVYATSRLSRGRKTRQREKEKKILHFFF